MLNQKKYFLFLEKYDLDPKIEFILEVNSGHGKMKHLYNGDEIKPDSKYIGVERKATLLEILTECTLQRKYNPNIEHLQVNSVDNIREDKLEKLL